jgi:arylsulfatase A-like enzyme
MKDNIYYLIKILLISLTIFLGSCNKINNDSKPNILLIVVDTLSAKHLAVYNPTLNNAPNLVKLAKNSIVFEKAYSSAPWTKPSIASIFTSLYPREHGVIKITNKFADNNHTLTEELKSKDYHTSAVVSHTLLKKGTGFEQGFDDFKLIPLESNVHQAISSKKVTELGIKAIKNHLNKKDGKPFFTWLHYFDPHYNYQHHPEFDRSSWYKGQLKPGDGIRKIRKLENNFTNDDIKYLIDLYHEEIAYTDKHIGRVLKFLEEERLIDNTIIIFTADHGEEFYEHGNIGHTRTLHDELINIPLIIHWKNKLLKTTVKEPVTTIDIFPTILKLLNLPEDNKLSGLPLISNNQPDIKPNRDIFSEVDFKSSAILAKQSGIIYEGNKLIKDFLNNNFSQYDFIADKDEKNNIYNPKEPLTKELSNKLNNFCSTDFNTNKEELNHSKEDIKQLKSLGYL